MVKMEIEPSYFTKLSKMEIISIDPCHHQNLSHSALQRFTDALLNSTNSVIVPDDILKQALQEEHQIRISPDMQSKFSEAELSHDKDWLEIVEIFQKKIAEKYAPLAGCTEKDFLRALRFQHCESFTPLWRLFNRAERGALEKSTIAPDCYLWEISNNRYLRLSDTLKPSSGNHTKLTVLIAGSFS
jgi:hypothetical protein